MAEYLDFIADGENYITAGDQFRVSGSGTGTHFPIIFYNTNSERHALDKQLTNPRTVNGVLRDGTSILHPVIVIEYTSVPSFNYAYIEKFKRYYYVTDVGSVVNNIWAISLDVDVLMSFGTQIRTCNAMVERNEYWYNLTLYDNRRVEKQTKTYTYMEGGLGIAPFDPKRVDAGSYRYLLTIAGTPDTDPPPTGTYPDISPLVRPGVGENYGASGQRMWALNNEQLRLFCDYLYNTGLDASISRLFSNPNEAIITVIAYPFDIHAHDPSRCRASTDEIVFGDYTSISGTAAWEIFSHYDNVFDVGSVPDPIGTDNWLRYPPAAKWRLWLPYCGWFDVDPNDMNASPLSVRYVIEMSTGKCKAYVYKTRSAVNPIVLTAEGQIGISIPLSSTDQVDITRNNIQMLTNGLTSMLAGHGAQNLLSAGMTAAFNPPTFRGEPVTGIFGRYSPYNPVIAIEHQVYTDEGPNYAHLEGRPLHETVGLSSLSGFTICRSVDLAGVTATKPELDQIESDLKGGVIL